MRRSRGIWDVGQLDRNHIDRNDPLATRLAVGDRGDSRPALHVAREAVEDGHQLGSFGSAALLSERSRWIAAKAVEWQAGTNASSAQTGALIASASGQADSKTILGLKELSRRATWSGQRGMFH
jgi:hypothetical protein